MRRRGFFMDNCFIGRRIGQHKVGKRAADINPYKLHETSLPVRPFGRRIKNFLLAADLLHFKQALDIAHQRGIISVERAARPASHQ